MGVAAHLLKLLTAAVVQIIVQPQVKPPAAIVPVTDNKPWAAADTEMVVAGRGATVPPGVETGVIATEEDQVNPPEVTEADMEAIWEAAEEVMEADMDPTAEVHICGRMELFKRKRFRKKCSKFAVFSI